ncbi:hypothetical protein L2E82_12445 [Cichorium intybus]|uniref:Uncharacterized protein n=1 Tax=Cichorium intybus TaxID=13427 RepID=A0ACB9GG32_CICIN|nr:hypothetical protein L2E82_12445 [Cichorium intybus]
MNSLLKKFGRKADEMMRMCIAMATFGLSLSKISDLANTHMPPQKLITTCRFIARNEIFGDVQSSIIADMAIINSGKCSGGAYMHLAINLHVAMSFCGSV